MTDSKTPAAQGRLAATHTMLKKVLGFVFYSQVVSAVLQGVGGIEEKVASEETKRSAQMDPMWYEWRCWFYFCHSHT